MTNRVGSITGKRTGGRRRTCNELGRNVARSGKQKRRDGEWQDDKVRELEQLARRKEDVVDLTQKKKKKMECGST